MSDQHYSTLGASIHDTADEIKSKYRKLARQHHPDHGGDAGRFRAIREAWEWLRDHHSQRPKRDSISREILDAILNDAESELPSVVITRDRAGNAVFHFKHPQSDDGDGFDKSKKT